MPTPTCVQHAFSSSNENYETGNAYKFALPDPSLANNCIVLFLTYAYSGGRTVSVTDDQSNTWPAVVRKVDEVGHGLTTACYVMPNAAAGTRTVTVTFDAPLLAYQCSLSEWYNVATASPTDGSAGATAAPGSAIASGSFSTAVDGDLILHHAIATGWGTQLNAGQFDGVTTLTKQSGYTLLQAHKWYMALTEYLVQVTHGATNPSAAVSGGSAASDGFNSITIALKSASAGTAPSATDVRVFGISHQAAPSVTTTADYPIWTPLVGNAVLITTTYSSVATPFNSFTGAVNGSLVIVAPGAPSAIPQAAYKYPITPSDVEVITMNLSNGGAGKLQYCVYDIVNATGFDKVDSSAQGAFGAGPTPHLPDVTPGVSSGVVIASCAYGTGPPNAVTAPVGAYFDSGYFTGYSDLDPYDSGDCYGHHYFTSTALQNWTWVNTQATGETDGLALTFSGTLGGGVAPPVAMPRRRVYSMMGGR